MGQARRWIILSALVLGALVAAGSPVLDVILAQERTESLAVEGADEVVTLDVETHNGRIDVVVGDRLTVEARVRWALRNPSPSVTVENGMVGVRDGCPVGGWPLGSCQVGFTITAPAGLTVRLTTTNGPIDFDDRAGDVEARSTNGRITAAGLEAGAVSARTTNGDVALSFDVAPVAVDTRTTNGGIELVVPDVSYLVQADTTNGRVTVDVDQDPSSGRRISATTTNGPVVVTTP